MTIDSTSPVLDDTLARLKKVSDCLSRNHSKFYKNLRKLPDDIRAGFCEIVRPPLAKLSEDMQAALNQFKKSDEYPLLVKNCNGIADPEKVALAKLFFDSKIRSIEEAQSL